MSRGGPDGAPLGRASTSHESSTEPPPLVAVFLVEFDARKGYSVTWQRSLPDLQLEGVVEYKSLPSGLHKVEEDLIYFIHDVYAGLSAFSSRTSEESQRNVLMLAVGVLVPLSYGRLGKSWRHAQNLKDLARQIITDPSRTNLLEEYWDKHRIREESAGLEGSLESPLGLKDHTTPQKHKDTPNRKRASSDAAALSRPSQGLGAHHPALSLPELVTAFGPLIFPLYKSALLRKRILLLGEPPVQSSCDFVYGLSILASIPQVLAKILPYDNYTPLTLRPLFNVGIHDIPYLTEVARAPDLSWIACTTDGVLAMKPALFDILVQLPSSSTFIATQHKSHPNIINSDPSLSQSLPNQGHQRSIKSTQRDARRYTNLHTGLNALPSSQSSAQDPVTAIDSDAASSTSSTPSTFSSTPSTYSNSSIVEPISWSQVAYTSFMWWASAGENATAGLEQEVENEQDSGLLLADLGDSDDQDGAGLDQVYRVPNRRMTGLDPSSVTKETALVSYFHRLTTLIFTTIAEIIVREDDTLPPPQYTDDQPRHTSSDTDSEDPEPNSTPANHSAMPSSDQASDSESEPGTNSDNAPLLPSSAAPQAQTEPAIIQIHPEDMTRMGLDIWSASDRVFVEELVGVWWGRKARVRGGEVRCCGVRVL
ncbi:MAG: hypothetical protein Q9160_004667 [Pyrenula sp. 1 TL-2023]